jgi:hypothetical protein
MKRAVAKCLLMAATALFLFNQVVAQESSWKRFRKLSCPEKRWVLFHPFVAKKAWEITQESQNAARIAESDSTLDGDNNGGQVDAFRHAFWMARLTQEICWRSVYQLGKAHEKGNKKEFKKKKNEEGSLPDFISCQMDFLNNDTGIQIGKDNPNASPEELSEIIKEKIHAGKLYVIKKDANKNSLDKDGNILKKEDYAGKWYNPRCLVPSNYIE